jgi:glutathione-regulated potassium-efflux system protein KefB
MQLLGDRGDIAQPQGQKIVAILLFEDLLIVPLLAIVAFMAPNHVVESTSARLENIGIGLIAIAGLIAAGYWLLNPLFRLLAAAKAREVMTAAALLVVLGAALLMQVSGLSMAIGASFRSTAQVLGLAGCDLLTIAPNLLAQLEQDQQVVEAQLS